MNWCRRMADVWGVWRCSVFMSSLRRITMRIIMALISSFWLQKKKKTPFSLTLLWLVCPVTSLASLVQSIHALWFSVPLNPLYSRLINISQTRPHTHPRQFTSLITDFNPSSDCAVLHFIQFTHQIL